MTKSYIKYFPYKTIREEQEIGIDFVLEAFLKSDKRFVIVEAGTGVGKSAVGYTAARSLNNTLTPDENYSPGTYYLTTQKILQDQYVKDYSKHGMTSIKSSTNYMCSYKKGNTCSESQKELRAEDKGSKFWNSCTMNCVYKKEKEKFLDAQHSVTNFPYFLTEATYSGKIKPREFLVIDEAHNIEAELGKFIEVSASERFCKSVLKIPVPNFKTQFQAVTWVNDVYFPKLSSYRKHVTDMLDKYKGLKDKLSDFVSLSRQLDIMENHYAKFKRFLQIYEKDNWVFELVPADGRKGKRLEFKPIDISHYAESTLFKLGKRILMMSATILDKDGFCELLGIDKKDVLFISIPSPFPVENRPIYHFPIGRMTVKEIDISLPKLTEAIKEILKQHKNDKGIIHCHTFRIAKHLKTSLRSPRIIMHNSENREEMLKKHMSSKKPSVLLSPSMTEGIDLHGNNSRFQIICKVPYPYLGDKIVKKRMNKWKWWYSLQTAKTIVQATGRSVRSSNDHAVTYILDADWYNFYTRNINYFPDDFKKCIKG